MRENFEKGLRDLNEIAKEDLGVKQSTEGLDEEGLSQYSDILDQEINKLAQEYHTDKVIQEEIYNLQKEKQKLMQQLKTNLQDLDKFNYKKEKLPNERLSQYSEATNKFIYIDEQGKSQQATLGEIITDMDWGIYYYLDPETTPKLIAKKYLVEKTKKQLLELLNKQIIKSETGGDMALPQRQEIYKIIDKRESQGVDNCHWGLTAEIMVKNFLKKLSIDKNLPFEVKEADIFQDVEEKIDFIIHKKERSRGVNVEIDGKTYDIGVQFTVSPQKIAEKRRQIQKSKQNLQLKRENIQDIALVVFPFTMASTLINKWEREGKPAGGPEKYLYKHCAEALFRKLLQGIFVPSEIEQYWKEIENNFLEDPKFVLGNKKEL